MRLVDISVTVLQETAGAYRVSDGVTTAWVPKSQVELSEPAAGAGRNGIFDCAMPEWLAKEKGFI